jgi:hypothetical protein
MHKLDLHSVTDLARYAICNQIIAAGSSHGLFRVNSLG